MMKIILQAGPGPNRRYQFTAEQEAILAKNAALGRARDVLAPRLVPLSARRIFEARAKRRGA
jgi:hypothetical protein